MTLGDYKQESDSINISEIEDKPFTMTGIERSDYTQEGKEDTKGVKISTVETWKREKDGLEVQKIHTTRRAIVSQLLNEDLMNDVNGGKKLKVLCPSEKQKPQGKGLPFYLLVDAQ